MSPTLIATVIIRNNQGEFLVHQRKGNKKTFPNLYGLGAGGHIDQGELPLSAAKRELREETGLTTPVKYLFTVHYEPYVIYVHETYTDNDITADSNEWQWSGWIGQAEVDALLADEKLCPDTALFYQLYIQDFNSSA